MKNLKKVLALVLAVVMIMGVVSVASAKTYTDVKATDNYADAIDALSSLKILDGFEDGNFKADGTLTRAQAAKIVAIVHNAATNGAIKDQDAISGLYSNALNPFVDCNGNWALPFINYCRITGLADGMTATTYAPNRELTGVQWLKLMLTTLNFDTAKEGYTGTGWDINVLNRANEIGLTAGLADGWKAIAPVKRGEAAQILYNALTKSLVEYGQNIKGYTPPVPAVNFIKGAFVTNETVEATGVLLGAKMGISIKRATDDFRRPGYNWSYGSWSAFYMDKPVNSYTTAVSACDILKNDMGIPETSKAAVKLNGWVKGYTDTDEVPAGFTATTKATKLDGAVNGTALNYYAVDGFKNLAADGDRAFVTLQHSTTKACQKDSGVWYNNRFGGTGDLTQVFKTEDGWVITTIHTFLAKVDSFVGTNKFSHATKAKATANVWIKRGSEVPTYGTALEVAEKYIPTADFAKGTMILVTMSLKDTEKDNLTGMYQGTGDNDAYVVDVAAADSKTGKLTGASDLAYAETVSIDGTKYNANCRFVLGTNDAMNIAHSGNAYTFYFDSYGNVIGCGPVTTASSYVVMDKIYAEHPYGIFTIKADLYDLEGKKLEDVTVAKAGSFVNATYGRPSLLYWQDGKLDEIAANNDDNLINGLYKYTVDDKGVYTLTWTGVYTSADKFMDGWSRYDSVDQGTVFSHYAKTAYISGANYTGESKIVNLSESTKFVVKGADNTWKAYTGYTALPELSAQYVDYVLDSDGYASIVYLGNATYAGDSVTGYVTNWRAFNWAGTYALITVYVDGEAKVLNVQPTGTYVKADGTQEPYTLTQGNEPKPGMYTFTTEVDENGVTYSKFVAYEAKKIANGYAEVQKTANDITAFTVAGEGRAFNVTGVKFYLIDAKGELSEVTAEYLEGAYVVVYGNDAINYATEVYIYDANYVPYFLAQP